MHRHSAILILATSFLHTRPWYSPAFSTSIGDIVNSLFLDKGKFHSSLRKLHSVVSVPSAEHPNQPLEVYHQSFSDFIQQVCHTGEFGITEADIMKTWWKCITEWCCILDHRKKTGEGHSMEAVSGAMKWPNQHSQERYDKLPAAAFQQIWSSSSDEIISAIIDNIHSVGFSHLWLWLGGDGLSEMIFKLNSQQEKNISQTATHCKVLRVEPHYPIDTELLLKYHSLLGVYHVAKADFDWAISKGQNQWSYYPRSMDCDHKHMQFMAKAVWHPHAMYFFFGHGAATKLVIMYQEQMEPQEYLREAFDQIGQASSISQSLISQHLGLLSAIHNSKPWGDRKLGAGKPSLIHIIPRISFSLENLIT
ncbi:hypothetical protein P691DRAFT_768652 [Macrolepiota fuliginosa MF-IS2]|uniref:Uncharacterized protein n=1 Tax=Macrolepiota fuliginosa MF-IS2 TaxID=1400762 RepID=A0A9P5WY61_9AGAR|nr:hypothetical protein P691DRAFT_768652 [Macrolepiota fuliginosa MF-IS2]